MINCSISTKIIFLFLVIGSISPLWGQRPPAGVGSGGGGLPGSNGGGQQQGQTSQEDEGPDSTTYDYIKINNPYKSYIVSDTLLDMKFLQDDPIYREGDEQFHTGNKGGASYPMIYRPRINTTWSGGFDNYNIYHKKMDDLQFFVGNRPMSDLYFSQLANQQNLNVGAKFSTNFKSGLSILADYDRISQQGYFRNQNTKFTGFATGMRFYQPKKRFQSFLMFIRNAADENHNGGQRTYSNLGGATNPQLLPVNLNDAKSRYQTQSIASINYLRLNSAKASKWRTYLKDDLIYTSSLYKYGDRTTSTVQDSSFYGPLLIDSRGLRNYVDVEHWHNGFYIHGEKIKGIQGRVGLKADYYNIKNNPIVDRRTDVSLYADADLPFFKAINLHATGLLGIGQNAGLFDIKGLLNINVGKFALLNGGIRFFNGESSYAQRTQVINNLVFQDTSFDRNLGTSIFAEISIPFIGVKAGIEQHVINNPIYFGTDGIALQKNSIYTHTHGYAITKWKLWRIHLDNTGHVQLTSDNIYPIPRIYSTHQLYYGGYLFKKAMQINVGLDGRWVESHKSAAFQPLKHAFYLDSDGITPNFSTYRFFLMSKVARFRAYFSIENVGHYWDSNVFEYGVKDHAYFDPQFRFSIRWIIKD